MNKIYNKLVRDNIPNIIRAKGETPTVKILITEEFNKQLDQKLVEEVNEYQESGNIEELADVVEVIYGILQQKGISLGKFERIRKSKAKKNGGFHHGIFLESVEVLEQQSMELEEPNTTEQEEQCDTTKYKED